MDNANQSETSDVEAQPVTISWKRNYVFVWLSQFLSLMGFAFALPFAPLYIQKLGITKQGDILFWTGIFMAGAPLTLAIMSPVWGMLSDKYGRKAMMLRANFGGAVVLFLMGMVSSIEGLVFLRLMQGIFSGTISAAMTMVAVSTPERRQGFAIGALSSAVFCGQLAGSAVGGYMADIFGYSACFKISGLITGISFLIILFGVKENFQRPVKTERKSQRRFLKLPKIGFAVPILLIFSLSALALTCDRAILPLFAQELLGGKIEGTATIIGQLTALCSISFIITGFLSGHAVDKISPQFVVKISAFVTAVFLALHAFVPAISSLFIIRPIMFLFYGTISPALQVWLMKTTPEEKRGELTGWSVTARGTSWVIGPIVSTNIAAVTGLRPIFVVAAFIVLMIIPAISWATRKLVPLES